MLKYLGIEASTSRDTQTLSSVKVISIPPIHASSLNWACSSYSQEFLNMLDPVFECLQGCSAVGISVYCSCLLSSELAIG